MRLLLLNISDTYSTFGTTVLPSSKYELITRCNSNNMLFLKFVNFITQAYCKHTRLHLKANRQQRLFVHYQEKRVTVQCIFICRSLYVASHKPKWGAFYRSLTYPCILGGVASGVNYSRLKYNPYYTILFRKNIEKVQTESLINRNTNSVRIWFSRKFKIQGNILEGLLGNTC